MKVKYSIVSSTYHILLCSIATDKVLVEKQEEIKLPIQQKLHTLITKKQPPENEEQEPSSVLNQKQWQSNTLGNNTFESFSGYQTQDCASQSLSIRYFCHQIALVIYITNY